MNAQNTRTSYCIESVSIVGKQKRSRNCYRSYHHYITHAFLRINWTLSLTTTLYTQKYGDT